MYLSLVTSVTSPGRDWELVQGVMELLRGGWKMHTVTENKDSLKVG